MTHAAYPLALSPPFSPFLFFRRPHPPAVFDCSVFDGNLTQIGRCEDGTECWQNPYFRSSQDDEPYFVYHSGTIWPTDTNMSHVCTFRRLRTHPPADSTLTAISYGAQGTPSVLVTRATSGVYCCVLTMQAP